MKSSNFRSIAISSLLSLSSFFPNWWLLELKIFNYFFLLFFSPHLSSPLQPPVGPLSFGHLRKIKTLENEFGFGRGDCGTPFLQQTPKHRFVWVKFDVVSFNFRLRTKALFIQRTPILLRRRLIEKFEPGSVLTRTFQSFSKKKEEKKLFSQSNWGLLWRADWKKFYLFWVRNVFSELQNGLANHTLQKNTPSTVVRQRSSNFPFSGWADFQARKLNGVREMRFSKYMD